jgi:hypothetical protein
MFFKQLKKIVTICMLKISMAFGYCYAADLTYPENSILLASQPGRQLMQGAHGNTCLRLLQHLTTQQTQAYCAVASAATVLNALALPRPTDFMIYPYHYFNQADIFSRAVLKEDILPKKVNAHGMTLPQLASVLRVYGAKVMIVHVASADDKASKAVLIRALQSSNQYVIINFSRAALGEVGHGHFSPLCGYNSQAKRALLLDVARYKYPVMWFPISSIMKAMATRDHSTQQFRGFLVVQVANQA